MTSILKVDKIQDAATQNTLNLGSGNSSLPGSLDLSGGGVYLGGTSSANYLDDYEEGTWTPSPNVGTFNTAQGYYVKIGKLVSAHCYVDTASDITSSTNFELNGLPFAASNDLDSVVGSVMLRYLDVGVTEEMAATTYIAKAASKMRIYVIAVGSTYQLVTHNEFSNGNIGLRAAIQYFTDA